jgi:restriction system protein
MTRRRKKQPSLVEQIKLGLIGVFILFAVWLISNHPNFVISLILLVIAVITGFYVFRYIRKLNRAKKQRLEEDIRRKEILASGIKEIDVMDGEEFERFLGTLLEEMGCTIEYTPKTGDFGADLVVTNRMGARMVIQAKRYSKTVGVEAVQQVKAAASHYKATVAFVITNRDFSENAYELAKSTNVRLLNRDSLIKLVNRKMKLEDAM